MVRFIMCVRVFSCARANMYLHSNMVRFIIQSFPRPVDHFTKFTFQYGQIYYDYAFVFYFYNIAIYIPIWLDLLYDKFFQFYFVVCIYIPIWLDLLSSLYLVLRSISQNLHSNMVRFIICVDSPTPMPCPYIYIPIWLDLLLLGALGAVANFGLFTFQYGQIYYSCGCSACCVRC